MAEWMREYFEHGYGQRFALDPPSSVTRDYVDCFWRLLCLKPGDQLLDIGCGHGKYAIAFQQRGAVVTGLDLTATLLYRASDIARDIGAAARWVQGDMRRLPFVSQKFQAAVSLDAFGFFESDEENAAVLSEAARVLTPGGRFVLKLVNAEPLMAHFRPTDREERAGTLLEIYRTLTRDPNLLIERITIRGAEGGGHYQRCQRLYCVEEISDLLRSADMIVKSVFSNPCGERFEPHKSPSMVVIGERAA
jgi:ubiquinone/menaquinone biosynthesis C-methylase UbiE